MEGTREDLVAKIRLLEFSNPLSVATADMDDHGADGIDEWPRESTILQT